MRKLAAWNPRRAQYIPETGRDALRDPCCCTSCGRLEALWHWGTNPSLLLESHRRSWWCIVEFGLEEFGLEDLVWMLEGGQRTLQDSLGRAASHNFPSTELRWTWATIGLSLCVCVRVYVRFTRLYKSHARLLAVDKETFAFRNSLSGIGLFIGPNRARKGKMFIFHSFQWEGCCVWDFFPNQIATWASWIQEKK